MRSLRPQHPKLPPTKKPCPECGRSISTSGRAWAAHQRMHQRQSERRHLPGQLKLSLAQ